MIKLISKYLNKAQKRPEKKESIITTVPKTLKAEMYVACYKYFSPGRFALQNGLMSSLEWFVDMVKSEMSEEELVQFKKEAEDYMNRKKVQ